MLFTRVGPNWSFLRSIHILIGLKVESFLKKTLKNQEIFLKKRKEKSLSANSKNQYSIVNTTQKLTKNLLGQIDQLR